MYYIPRLKYASCMFKTGNILYVNAGWKTTIIQPLTKCQFKRRSFTVKIQLQDTELHPKSARH